MCKTVLIVAAHADDEALGCGGAIARHAAEGDNVYAVFMADGVSSRALSTKKDLEGRNVAAERARKILGIKKCFYLGLPDNRMDSVPMIEIVRALEPIVQMLKPTIVYTHHDGDLNIDHRITHQALITACRPAPNFSVREIYAFEIMSSTEWSAPTSKPFVPNHYVDITEYLDTKLESLAAYAVEMRAEPHSRSIAHLKNLAHHRGNSVGMLAAEAFLTIRTLC